jgi:hypothetical protein
MNTQTLNVLQAHEITTEFNLNHSQSHVDLQDERFSSISILQNLVKFSPSVSR